MEKMAKLYRAYNNYINDEDDVLIFFAENDEKAKEYIIEKHVEDYEQYLYETYFGDLLDEIEAFYDEAVEFIAKKDFEGLARLSYIKRSLIDWNLETFDIDENQIIYACYPRDINSKDDVEVVLLQKDYGEDRNIKLVVDELVSRESERESFREHVQDKAINMSFNERFFCDEKGYIFDDGAEFTIREDLKDKLKTCEDIDCFWLENVHDFFDNEYYRDLYIEYIDTDADPSMFSDMFYYHVAKRLFEKGEWIQYDIQKVVMYP